MTGPAMAATKAAKPAAAKTEIQKMQYDVYAGGINAVDAELDVVFKAKDRYDIELTAATKGFLRVLAPWSGSFESHGWRRHDGLDQPELHKSIATWRSDNEIKEYSYDQKGNFLKYSIKDEENDGTPKDVDPELTQGTTDALTAVLGVMKRVGAGKACGGTAEVFDGDRRFELTFQPGGTEDLKATRYNVYEGPSEKCTVEVKPKGGKWHEKPRGWLSIQEQGRQHGMLPTVWFAKLDPNGPAVPVKIMIKSDYGAMLAHLTGYTNNDGVQSAQIVDGVEQGGDTPTPVKAAEQAAEPVKNQEALRD